MSSEDTEILEFNQYQQYDKAPFILYAYCEQIIEKIDGCKNNSENSSTTKVSEHILSDFSLSIISSFRSIENQHNKHDVYTGKGYIKNVCEFLREHALKKNNFTTKKNKDVKNKRAARIK